MLNPARLEIVIADNLLMLPDQESNTTRYVR